MHQACSRQKLLRIPFPSFSCCTCNKAKTFTYKVVVLPARCLVVFCCSNLFIKYSGLMKLDVSYFGYHIIDLYLRLQALEYLLLYLLLCMLLLHWIRLSCRSQFCNSTCRTLLVTHAWCIAACIGVPTAKSTER